MSMFFSFAISGFLRDYRIVRLEMGGETVTDPLKLLRVSEPLLQGEISECWE